MKFALLALALLVAIACVAPAAEAAPPSPGGGCRITGDTPVNREMTTDPSTWTLDMGARPIECYY